MQGFRFGGCLADDMGLGKTVQVLAMLETRRTRPLARKEKRTPSLVVVPKSLVFNWLDEGQRFARDLRLLNYTGPERKEKLEQLDRHDVLITTYGTLRRDIGRLREIRFDYAILDESQGASSLLRAKSIRSPFQTVTPTPCTAWQGTEGRGNTP